ncbi:hypothetical protein M2451_003042 [Dysgonomonas sp. PFB1-18]|uniref:WG repeat-containing protein n=1 Tax=unclassified Dysgonomonas TaxID=2630389 RepID=UPI002476FEF7|nr:MULTISPECIES: WG repeat-containing protein [unclassified Dysgonomonas]MDH6310150.1 hypothetical protein [Dysgonomonas sp. PF1-14]MDH6340184.1 hypothetical protein [Dysgonomonas sp. PF1-16]MDH6381707.1 hypothetical protein [Dysgonomonas sp. PFB1-18]MDH6399066.1 hypothetical protein [Dysgonomonas sp. PF1-23]
MKSNNLYPVFAYGKWGAVDRNGNQVIPIIYTYCRNIMYDLSVNNVVIVIKDDKYGLLDIDSCKEIIPTIYDNIWCYDEKFWCVQRDSKWYLWKKGSFYIIGEYDSVSFINEEFIQLEKSVDNEFGYKRYVKLSFVYSIAEKRIVSTFEAHIFYNDLAKVCINGKYGFVNRSLELVIPATYDYVENFENGFAYVKIENNEYYIDTMGLRVISGPFYHADYSDENCHDDTMFMEGIWSELVCYEKDEFIGLKGLQNRIITLPIYDFIGLAYRDNDKYISVVKNGKYGVIDKDGNTIIECQYDCLWSSSELEDIFLIGCDYMEGDLWRKREYGIININNEFIIPPIYGNIHIINNNMAIVAIDKKREYKYGVLDFHLQKIIIPLIYDECSFYGNLFFVAKKGKWGYLDLEGNEIMKIEQDFDYSVYKDFNYYRADDRRWGWEDYCGRTPDFSKCILQKEVCFKDWKPVFQEECPF